MHAATPQKKKPAATAKSAGTAKSKSANGKPSAATAKGKAGVKGKAGKASAKSGRAVVAAPTAESRKLSSAFTASAQLRPMAQQLVATRTPAAFSGVATYAATHPGEAASAAQLAVGHAYALDRRYSDAQSAFRLAGMGNAALADYADYLGAQAAVQSSHGGDASALLDHFADRHPGSIFIPSVPVLLANAYLQQNNPQGAIASLTSLNGTPAASKTDFRLALAKAYQAAGNSGQAADLYRGIYLRDPLSVEAGTARAQLTAINAALSPGERKQHADAMFNAKHYAEAETEVSRDPEE